MQQTLVLTFIAEDRPGLVERLSEAVTKEGGNWLESRMAHLAEKFAGIARVEIPGDKVSSFKNALMALEAEGFRLTVEEATVAAPSGGTVLTLDLVGPDHPGIVRDISHCLAERGVSVEEMETDIRQAPMGGGALFYAQARVRGPARLNEEELRQALEGLTAALMVDITLREEILSPNP
ncbi:MAG: ACT domain-containing protein [Hyphomicrobiales bacterium]|nr:ACT domain-containing protein [Hyphomicrobiales bacterium]